MSMVPPGVTQGGYIFYRIYNLLGVTSVTSCEFVYNVHSYDFAVQSNAISREEVFSSTDVTKCAEFQAKKIKIIFRYSEN